MNGEDHEPRGGAWVTIALSVGALALGLLYFTRTAWSAADSLDPSWKAVLGHDLIEGRQSGKDTVFNYGPLGYFLADELPYIPALYRTSIVMRVLFGIGAAAVLLAAGRTVRPWPAAVIGAAALILVVPCLREVVHLAALGALPLAVAAARTPRLEWLSIAGVYAFALAFAKHNMLVAAVIALACVLAIVAHRRGLRFAAIIAGVFAVELVVVWAAARQDPRNLPAYFAGAADSLRDYAEAMAVPEPAERRVFTIATAVAFTLAALAGLVTRARQRDFPGVVAMIAILATGSIAVRLGLIRSDDGHRQVANGVILLLAVASAGSRASDVLRGIAIGGAAVGLFISSASFAFSAARVPSVIERHVRDCAAELLDPERVRSDHDELRRDLARRNALPRLAAAIGAAPVDLIGASQGVLYLAGMNVRHRPVFQDYAVLSPALNARNAAFFERADAPRFVLVRLWGIDGRYPTISDSGSIRALLLHYRPVNAERGYTLFERQPRLAAPAPARVRARSVGFGETLDLSDLDEGLLEMSVEIAPSAWGRVEGLFGRPPLFWMTVTAEGIERRYRIAPPLVRTPFVLSPLVDSTQALVDLWGRRTRSRVTSVRFEVEEGRSGSVAPEIAVTVWSDGAAWSRLGARNDAGRLMRFPTFKTPPDEVPTEKQVWPIEEPGVEGVMAHAPATLSWNLAAGSWHARGRYGMLPRSWEEGTTDGVVVVAEVVREGAAPRELLRKDLAPRTRPKDREPGTFDLSFELDAPARLLLRTDPGPAGNAEWDWAWWSDLAIERAR